MRKSVIIDQMGEEVVLPNIPKRIISLVPSQTELLFDLGLSDRLVGITKFCVHPKNLLQEIPIIGGTKNFNFDKIDALTPDLIIGNKEENYQEGINQLKSKYPVWMSNIYHLKDALEMVIKVSILVNCEEKGKEIIKSIKYNFSKIVPKAPKKVLYFIWQKPYMVAGKNTFIDEMLSTTGLINACDQERYPELTEEEIQQINPDLILLSSEPFPFKPKHFKDFNLLSSNAEIHIVDGEMFSWYGSRLIKAPLYFNTLNF